MQLPWKHCCACKSSHPKVIRIQSSGQQSAGQADRKRKQGKEQQREGGACLAEHVDEYRESHSVRKTCRATFCWALWPEKSKSRGRVGWSHLGNVWSNILKRIKPFFWTAPTQERERESDKNRDVPTFHLSRLHPVVRWEVVEHALLFSHASHEQMLISFIMVNQHHVLIGKMSPDIEIPKKKKKREKGRRGVLVWFMELAWKIRPQHPERFDHPVELAV